MKVNFIQKNEKELKALFLELGFSGYVLAGKFGANSFTVWDLLHNTSIDTLRSLNRNLKKEVTELRDQDEWSFTPHQKAKAAKTEKWQKFINLLIGFKIKKDQDSGEASRKRMENTKRLAMLKGLKLKAEIDELGDLTPSELQAQIDEIEAYS